LIEEHAAGDPDEWWYANRYVFARLGLDERKTKTSIKRDLFDANKPCHYCGKPFETKRNVHLHRLDQTKGYSKDNCVLMHAECHRQVHAATQQEKPELGTDGARGRPLSASRWSKCYEGMPFLYWWDVSPGMADSIDAFDAVEFGKKDTREVCTVPAETLKAYLTPDRQTSRGRGNWGVKVLKDHQDELAFEPGTGKAGKYLFLPVIWINELEED